MLNRLLVGQATSMLGAHVTRVALPLAAIQLFHASGWQVGLLSTLVLIPVLVLGLPVGAWIDRSWPRAVMIVSDVARWTRLPTWCP